MKLLAIDGNSIINRAFYGIRLLSTKSGEYTNAVYGFINILNKLVAAENPDGIAVAFDLKKPTFRHKMYAEYKAGRHAMPEELKSQFPLLKEWLTLAGHTCIACEGFEADDILGTLANAAVNSGNECVIATGDRDSLQLVSPATRVLLTVTKAGSPEIKDYTPQRLLEDYGLTPEQMIELKALMGDSSDNLPGVAGIGQKTATDLITKFGNIDYIYENIDTIDVKNSVREKLIKGRDSAFLSRTLGTICKEAPISTDFNTYKTHSMNTEKLSVFMTRLELFTLMQRMNITPAEIKSEPQKSENFTLTDNLQIKDSVDLYGKFAICQKNICLLSEEKLKEILASEKIKKRVYGLKAISKKYAVKGVTFDLNLAAYLCDPAAKDYSVKALAEKCSFSVKGLNEEQTEAALFSLLCDKYFSELEETEQLSLLTDIEIPLATVLGEMETEGFLVDKEGLKRCGEELKKRTEEIANQIYIMAGEEFNLNSPKQLGVILFEKMGLPCKKKTKSGYSTNADVLEDLRKDYPVVELILEYRQLAKLKSTYCDGLYNAAGDDGRIHTTFNQTEARTGRISSLEPNLQNIPVRTGEGKKLREFFIARKGFVLCDADYSQIELRVLASIANDETMINAFKSGTDIHTVTASEVFDMPVPFVTPEMRSRAKAVNFGIVYGIGAFSLGKDIGVPQRTAKEYINKYLCTYKGVADYMEQVIENAKRDGYVKTAFGRRRYLPELHEKNAMMRAFGERVARNAPIQGTAADIIKIAMVKVNERLKRQLPQAKLILQVHDELIVEAPECDADAACKILEEEMQNAAKMKVTFSVDAHKGENWLIAKG